jgi:DNA-binding NarL/FixJ family response regulator
MSNEINILIADDHPQFIEGVEMFLQTRKNYNVLGKATNGIDLLNHPLLNRADVVLLDCEMPGLNGLETARRIDFQFPRKKMIAVTMFQDQINLLELLGAGFKGYIYKPNIAAKIEGVIERVLNDEYVFDDKLKGYINEKPSV